MARSLVMSRAAGDFVKTLDAKQYKQVVQRVLALPADPQPADSSKLEGSDYLRIDQGEFRIVYEFDADQVRIILIDRRNDDKVYKELDRLKRGRKKG